MASMPDELSSVVSSDSLVSEDEYESDSDKKPENHSNAVSDNNFESKTNIPDDWAKAMKSVLNTSKPKNKSYFILSKANYLRTKRTTNEERQDVSEHKSGVHHKKKEWLAKGRRKPHLNERERERTLRSIAIRGVVQLFNAVGKHQNVMKKKDEGVSVTNLPVNIIDKKSFLNMLIGKSTTLSVCSVPNKTEVKEEAIEPKSESWDVLKSDFLMGAKLKDWDIEAVNS